MKVIKKSNLFLRSVLTLAGVSCGVAVILLFASHTALAFDGDTTFQDGIYNYTVISEENKKVALTDLITKEKMEELTIPATIMIKNVQYTVETVTMRWSSYWQPEYATFYNGVQKLNIESGFSGEISIAGYTFPNLKAIEFQGTTVAKSVDISVNALNFVKDVLFLVPKGMEKTYRNIIHVSMDYSMASDLYEQSIDMTPIIEAKETKEIEYQCFSVDGYIYQVTKSAKSAQEGIGEVQLIGMNDRLKRSYVKLPEQVKYNGLTYQLTKLCRFSLIGCGATVVVIPDSVKSMDPSVLDRKVELLFLSKNCKTIPNALIADENSESNIRFVYVPEGVTTISDNSFNKFPRNTSSIILPETIKTVGKGSLYAFKLVTFLNKKPIAGIAGAIKTDTTVKVQKSVISSYQKVLGKKISVVAAKDIVKSKSITVGISDIKAKTIKTVKIPANLTKGSNETIYWLSANTDILDVKSDGTVVPKKAGETYVVAYTRTSGLHKVVKVTVTETVFRDGIFSYRITNPDKLTVTLCSVRPDKKTEDLCIPEKITYKKKTYTVTGVIADPENISTALIAEQYSNNNIKKITFPKAITGKIGHLGILKNIKSITFLGKKAPEEVWWYMDGGYLAFHAVIYVPKGSVGAYTSALYMSYLPGGTYAGEHYGCPMDYNILETGSDQMQRFVVGGILYRVTKKAGKTKGTVMVKGVDINLKKITIGKTVTYGGYTYDVTEIYKKAFERSKAETIDIDPSIKKRNAEEKYDSPVNYVL